MDTDTDILALKLPTDDILCKFKRSALIMESCWNQLHTEKTTSMWESLQMSGRPGAWFRCNGTLYWY